MTSPDVCIAGAGIIGLSLALALERRGLRVLVLDAGSPMQEASSAAAGMLAVEDPENPSTLLPLARFSRGLYPAFLDSLASAQEPAVRFQTHRTVQALGNAPHSCNSLRSPELERIFPALASPDSRFLDLEEVSLDPRELAHALLAAVAHSSVRLERERPALSTEETASGVLVQTPRGLVTANRFVDCTGAWFISSARLPFLRVAPRKGQMLAVPTPPSLAGGIVLRTPEVYLVPRVHGPRAGQTILGATVEDAGFDRTVHPWQLADLLERATALLPELGGAPILSGWSGLRPATPDLLPLLGVLPGCSRLFIASGHYRNGILLAPGTAEVMAQLLIGDRLALSLADFSPDRRTTTTATADAS